MVLLPMYWIIYTALLPEELVYSWPPRLIPSRLMPDYFINIFKAYPILRWMMNSFIVSLFTVCISVPPAVLAGYGFYRYTKFRGRSTLFSFLFLVTCVPPTIIIIPYFIMLNTWGLIDTLIGLAITYVSFVLPLQVILYYSYLFSIPREIEEAAMIDGASKLRILTSIILPLSYPGIAAISIYAFNLAWNEFAFAITLLRSQSNWTTVIGIYSFIGQWKMDWNGAMVTSIYTTIPSFIFFFLTQKYFIKGLTAGALKGK